MSEVNFKATEFGDSMTIADPHDRSQATGFAFWDGSVTISRLALDVAGKKRENGTIELPWETVEVLAAVVQAVSLQPTERVK